MMTPSAVLGYYITFAGTASPANRPEASTLTALVNAFFLLSVATNLISTGLRSSCPPLNCVITLPLAQQVSLWYPSSDQITKFKDTLRTTHEAEA